MNNRFLLLAVILSILYLGSCSNSDSKQKFMGSWSPQIRRHWPGPEFWANRLEDWQINEGRLECINGTLPARTVHILTHELSEKQGSFSMSVKVGLISNSTRLTEDDWCGILLGAGALNDDYRRRALIHNGPGKNGGLIAGINGAGKLIFLDNENNLGRIVQSRASEQESPRLNDRPVTLKIEGRHAGNSYTILLQALDAEDGTPLAEAEVQNIEEKFVSGNIALIANGATDGNGASFWFKDLTVGGSKVAEYEERAFGPVWAVFFTTHEHQLFLNAQFAPVCKDKPIEATLELSPPGENQWTEAQKNTIDPISLTATFHLKNFDNATGTDYRISIPADPGSNTSQRYYTGTIPPDPETKEQITLAAFSHMQATSKPIANRFDFVKPDIAFPFEDYLKSAHNQAPDVLVFAGGQVFRDFPTELHNKTDIHLDYLYKWGLFCWATNEYTRNTPTIIVPSATDYYQEELWGEGGKTAPPFKGDTLPPFYSNDKQGLHRWQCEQGGFVMPADFISLVEKTQTSHMPPSKIPGAFFTSINIGGVSFAVVEDKKFKSSPSVALPDAMYANHLVRNPWIFDPSFLNSPTASLLGDAQTIFLTKWASDFKASSCKILISNSLFASLTPAITADSILVASGNTLSSPPIRVATPPGLFDLGQNGWPQNKRNLILKTLRQAHALHLCAERNQGALIHYGTDLWNDAGYAFNIAPLTTGNQRTWKKSQDDVPDMLGNKVSITHLAKNAQNKVLAGFSTLVFERKSQKLRCTCLTNAGTEKLPEPASGWPVEILVQDNYGKQAIGFLPTISVVGLQKPPVVQLFSKSGELIYSYRATSYKLRPRVFEWGSYTIVVGEPGTGKVKTIENLQGMGEHRSEDIYVSF